MNTVKSATLTFLTLVLLLTKPTYGIRLGSRSLAKAVSCHTKMARAL